VRALAHHSLSGDGLNNNIGFFHGLQVNKFAITQVTLFTLRRCRLYLLSKNVDREKYHIARESGRVYDAAQMFTLALSRRIVAAAFLLAFVAGSVSAFAVPVIESASVCTMRCCVNEARCCCSPRRSRVSGERSGGSTHIEQAGWSRACTDDCASGRASSSYVSKFLTRGASAVARDRDLSLNRAVVDSDLHNREYSALVPARAPPRALPVICSHRGADPA